MAANKKVKEVEEEIPEEQPIEETTEIETQEEAVNETKDVMEQEGIKHPVYIPDDPAQMTDEQAKSVGEFIEAPITTKAEIEATGAQGESGEILFLRRILQIQEEGCFGRHLNQLIYDRIKELKK